MADPPLGVVLVGGTSRRMGRDKARVEWRGRTLVERAVAALDPVLPEVAIVGGGEEDYGFTGRSVSADRRPGLGPLGGLETAFRLAAGRPVFALACDLPRVRPDLVAWLLREAAPAPPDEAWAWVPSSAGRLQPLCGVYGAGCAEPLDDYLAAGERRAVEFLDRIAAHVVAIEPGHPVWAPNLLVNVNRPEDLALADPGGRQSGEGSR